MIGVVQRVSKAAVSIDQQEVGRINSGIMLLLGVAHDDSEADCRLLAKKIVNLRIFEDDAGKMNKSLLDINGQLLVVSQFTLLADCRKGRRPSFHLAASPEIAEPLYQAFIRIVEGYGVTVAQGRFQAMMSVEIHNDGPVTLIVDSLNRRGNKPKPGESDDSGED